MESSGRQVERGNRKDVEPLKFKALFTTGRNNWCRGGAIMIFSGGESRGWAAARRGPSVTHHANFGAA